MFLFSSKMSRHFYPPLQGLFLSIKFHGLVFRAREGSHIVSLQKSISQPDVEEYKLYNLSQVQEARNLSFRWKDVTA